MWAAAAAVVAPSLPYKVGTCPSQLLPSDRLVTDKSRLVQVDIVSSPGAE